jgi:hypothetical protein
MICYRCRAGDACSNESTSILNSLSDIRAEKPVDLPVPLSPVSDISGLSSRSVFQDKAHLLPSPEQSASAFTKVFRRPAQRAEDGGLQTLQPPQVHSRAPLPAPARCGSDKSHDSFTSDFSLLGAPASWLPPAAFSLGPPSFPLQQPAGLYEESEGSTKESAARMEEELGRLYGMHLNSLMQIQAQLQLVRGQVLNTFGTRRTVLTQSHLRRGWRSPPSGLQERRSIQVAAAEQNSFTLLPSAVCLRN